MTAWSVRHAQLSDVNLLAEMRALLWPEGSFEMHRREVEAFLNGTVTSTLPAAMLVAELNGRPIGFLDVDLRSHADGCDPAKPVGYVEGWFVYEPFREQGAGKELMRAAENWAREQGCAEMASDVLIDNEGSQRAHAALGFEVVDRCVHYRKAL